MPKIGEVRTAKEIGKAGNARHVWHACVDCGKKRWVCLLGGDKPINLRCHTCAYKHIQFNPPVDHSSIIHYRETHPCATLALIGSNFGVTRERVRQLLKKDGVATKHVPVPKQQYECLNCGKAFIPNTYKGHDASLEFCCGACSKEYHSIILICDQCGIEFKRPQRFVCGTRQPHKYICCSRKCYGQLIGRKFGFIAHPENQRLGKQRKLNDSQMENLIQDRLTGMNYKNLGAKYSISQPTLWYYLKKANLINK